MTDLPASTDPNDLPVSTLVGDEVLRVTPEATLLEVAGFLIEKEIGLAAVGDGPRPVGVVSERDLVRALARGLDMATTTAMDVAHTELCWVESHATIADVANEMMSNWVRHVLVGRDGELVGVVSVRDLVGVYASSEDVEGR